MKLKSSGLEYWMRYTATGAVDEADCMEPEYWMRYTGTAATMDEVDWN